MKGAARESPREYGSPLRFDLVARDPSMAASESRPRHILVVNDTEEILDLFRDIVEGLGHRMTAWSFSPDDLAKITRLRPTSSSWT